MMSIEQYFWSNLGTNITLTIAALIIAIIFIIMMDKFFNITMKDPINFKFSNKNPVGKIPRMRNPMQRIR